MAVTLFPTRAIAEEFCGVAVPPGVTALLQRLKAHYGRPVACVFDPALGDRGVPFTQNGELSIHINPTSGRNSLTIAHELLHIELDSKGFAANPLAKFPPPPGGISTQREQRFAVLLYDEIQHRLIFPRLKQIGFPEGDSEFLTD